MPDLSEWRDLGLILLAVGFGVVSLACLVATLIAGRIGFRVIRGLQRLHDDRLLTLLNTIEQRQASWREQGLLEPQGLPELARRARRACDTGGGRSRNGVSGACSRLRVSRRAVVPRPALA